ncbi:hypothetical protein ACJU26_04465 [Acidithiobacillus sp. M4-SHS-6]|uniref:hypothetical protein n=1 Tax=Acidithiobacillus sp. M4-SHS-6 TaxID=3383024 RepID=UPI0039BE1678
MMQPAFLRFMLMGTVSLIPLSLAATARADTPHKIRVSNPATPGSVATAYLAIREAMDRSTPQLHWRLAGHVENGSES